MQSYGSVLDFSYLVSETSDSIFDLKRLEQAAYMKKNKFDEDGYLRFGIQLLQLRNSRILISLNNAKKFVNYHRLLSIIFK